jgi:acetyltransferase-like isoleucine patch superfamily enzyme
MSSLAERRSTYERFVPPEELQVLDGLKWHILSRIRSGTHAARAMGVTVGEGCRILSGRYGSEPWLITIGDRVTISGGVVLMTHEGSLWLARDERGRRYRFSPITIGNDVFIGADSLVMPGVTIGDRVIVGAGSVLTRSVPSNCVVAGNPARFLRSFEDWEADALTNQPSDQDLRGTTMRERVASVLDATPRPDVKRSTS